jgi:hypothetical protein
MQYYLKPLCQLEPNRAGMMFGKPSTKFPNFVRTGQKAWPPCTILFCLFLKLVQINFIFTDNVRILYIYHPTIDRVSICYVTEHYDMR